MEATQFSEGQIIIIRLCSSFQINSWRGDTFFLGRNMHAMHYTYMIEHVVYNFLTRNCEHSLPDDKMNVIFEGKSAIHAFAE